jgi:hypothetical protein
MIRWMIDAIDHRQRINRKLRPDDETLKVTRGWQAKQALGEFYILDHRRDIPTGWNVDPEDYAREIGVLQAYEYVAEDAAS